METTTRQRQKQNNFFTPYVIVLLIMGLSVLAFNPKAFAQEFWQPTVPTQTIQDIYNGKDNIHFSIPDHEVRSANPSIWNGVKKEVVFDPNSDVNYDFHWPMDAWVTFHETNLMFIVMQLKDKEHLYTQQEATEMEQFIKWIKPKLPEYKANVAFIRDYATWVQSLPDEEYINLVLTNPYVDANDQPMPFTAESEAYAREELKSIIDSQGGYTIRILDLEKLDHIDEYLTYIENTRKFSLKTDNGQGLSFSVVVGEEKKKQTEKNSKDNTQENNKTLWDKTKALFGNIFGGSDAKKVVGDLDKQKDEYRENYEKFEKKFQKFLKKIGYKEYDLSKETYIATAGDYVVNIGNKMFIKDNHLVTDPEREHIEQITAFVNSSERTLTFLDRYYKFGKQHIGKIEADEVVGLWTGKDGRQKYDIFFDIKGSMQETAYQKPIEYMTLELFSKLYPKDVAKSLAVDFSLIYGPTSGGVNPYLRVSALFQFQVNLMNATFGELNKIVDSWDDVDGFASNQSPLMNNPSSFNSMVETNDALINSLDNDRAAKESKMKKENGDGGSTQIEDGQVEEGEEGVNEDSGYSLDKFKKDVDDFVDRYLKNLFSFN